MRWSNMTAMLLIRSSYYLRSVTVETVMVLSKLSDAEQTGLR